MVLLTKVEESVRFTFIMDPDMYIDLYDAIEERIPQAIVLHDRVSEVQYKEHVKVIISLPANYEISLFNFLREFCNKRSQTLGIGNKWPQEKIKRLSLFMKAIQRRANFY